MAHDKFERVLVALTADATVARIMVHATTRLHTSHICVDTAKHACAAVGGSGGWWRRFCRLRPL